MKKKYAFIIFSLVILVLITGCGQQKLQSIKSKPALPETEVNKPIEKLNIKDCVCVQLWMPVCGENGKTYSNACFAQCAGVKFSQGSCSKIITD